MPGRGRFIALLSIAIIAAAAVAVACGSGSSSKKTPTVAAGSPAASTPAPGTTGTPGALATVGVVGTAGPTITPSPISAAQKTALALGAAVGFTDFKDPSGRYIVAYPDGWAIQSTALGSSATLGGAPATAQLGVFCAKGDSVDALISADHQTQAQNHLGNMPTDSATPTTVAGTDAKEIVWEGAYLDTPQKHWFIYFESHGCAWRLLLTTLPGADENAMQQIFKKMVESFRFT